MGKWWDIRLMNISKKNNISNDLNDDYFWNEHISECIRISMRIKISIHLPYVLWTKWKTNCKRKRRRREKPSKLFLFILFKSIRNCKWIVMWFDVVVSAVKRFKLVTMRSFQQCVHPFHYTKLSQHNVHLKRSRINGNAWTNFLITVIAATFCHCNKVQKFKFTSCVNPSTIFFFCFSFSCCMCECSCNYILFWFDWFLISCTKHYETCAKSIKYTILLF